MVNMRGRTITGEAASLLTGEMEGAFDSPAESSRAPPMTATVDFRPPSNYEQLVVKYGATQLR